VSAAAASQIKAIHVLKGQAGISENDYRTHLQERFKVVSSKDLSFDQAGALMDDLRKLSGGRSGVRQPLAQKGTRSPAKTASGKFRPVLQALWLAAYNLAIVDNPDDAALLAFMKRQCRVEHDRFLNDGVEAAKAIEALKSWISRESGFVFATKKQADDLGVTLAWLNKRGVVYAIARKLKAFLPTWDIESFALLEGLPNPPQCSEQQLDRLAGKMGRILRERTGK
jgi:hypothetical protein